MKVKYTVSVFAVAFALSFPAFGSKAPDAQGSVAIGSARLGRLVFHGADDDFACQALHYGKSRFIDPAGAPNCLWRLTFRAGVNGTERILEPSAAKSRRYRKTARGVRFIWERLDLDAGDGAVDVICDVTCNDREERFEFRIKVENRSGRYGLFDTEYPRLSSVVRPGKGTFVHPGGNWGGGKRRIPLDWKKIYPDFDMPVQFAAFDADTGDGVMVAALDADARIKYFVTDKSFGYSYLVPAEGAGLPGAKGATPFAVAVHPYRGDWWKAAKYYRRWAEKAKVKWLSKGLIADRKDFPKSMRDPGFWLLLMDPVPKNEADVNLALKKLRGRLPLSIHWYGWSVARKHGDPIYPTYFPAHADFSNAVKRCVAKGVHVMPYMNARIWGHLHPGWPKARRYACAKPDGSPYIEVWREKDFSAMCQYNKFWRDDVVSVADELYGKYGVSSLYLDQVASMTAVICYSSEHGHPVGGGSHWVDGYRQMTEDIRKKHPDKPMTSENFCEPYIDSFENFLLWCPNRDTDVPLIPAVYSGYIQTFACVSLTSYTMEAFRAVHGRGFLWGTQGGWCRNDILLDVHADKFEYVVRLAELRRKHLDFFSDGELVGEVVNKAQATELCVDWIQYGKPLPDQRIPSVQAARWRNQAGKEMVAVANYSDREQPFDGGEPHLRFRLAPGEVRVVK